MGESRVKLVLSGIILLAIVEMFAHQHCHCGYHA